MKSARYLAIVLPLAMLVTAMPAIPGRALRVPLQRRSYNAGNTTSAQSAMGERFYGSKRVANFVGYTRQKYANTFAAYERNTGSRHPLDTRSRSSSSDQSKRASKGTVDLSNESAELWYGDLTIGTPPQSLAVDFDTGSADLIVADKNCPLICDGHNKYDPNESSTSTLVSPVPLAIAAYGSGEVAGVQYSDSVGVGGYEIKSQRFGSSLVESPAFFAANFEPDGISGLGFTAISALRAPTLMDNLKSSGQLSQLVFSFKLSTMPDRSELIIGGVDSAAFKADTLVSASVTTVGYWQVQLGALDSPSHRVSASIGASAVIDTGTTLLMAPLNIVNDYFNDVQGASCGTDGTCTVPCNTINSTAPTLTFGGKTFTVSPETWNLGPVSKGSTDCIAGLGIFLDSFVIVGDVFLQNVYAMFDFSDPPSVKFAELA